MTPKIVWSPPKNRWAREARILNICVARLLIAAQELPGRSITVLAREVGTTYAHASRTMGRLRKLNLVKLEKKGRVKLVRLTEEGQRVTRAVKVISPWRVFHGPEERSG